MRTEQLEKLASDSDLELEKIVHRSAPTDQATLEHLLWVLDARRRGRESLVIEQTAQACVHRR